MKVSAAAQTTMIAIMTRSKFFGGFRRGGIG
jgi:hypothetical protein